MEHAYVFGLVGPICTAQARKTWNSLITIQKIDGFFDFYRTKNPHDLALRCSEMFLLERRGYIIDESLQQAACCLMDSLHESALAQGRVDTVMNRGGVLVGYFFGNTAPELILQTWMGKQFFD